MPWKEFALPSGVTPIAGEANRFYVASRSGGAPYLVDLGEAGFNGFCPCMDFGTRHFPKLKEDRREKRPQRNRRCWHIRRALLYKAEVAIRADEMRAAPHAAEYRGRRPPPLPPATEDASNAEAVA